MRRSRSRSRRYGQVWDHLKDDPASSLLDFGYVTLPLAVDLDPSELPRKVQEYWRGAPELLPDVRSLPVKQIVGGTGKLPIASAWHAGPIREIRRMAHAAAAPTLRAAHEKLRGRPCSRVIIIPDPLVVRDRPNKSLKPEEKWHRDSARYYDDRHVVFGGWVNLGTEKQYFACVPRSHMKPGGTELVDVEKIGFVPESEAPKTSDIRYVEINPGMLLVFYERLKHTVLSHPCTRLFTGFATTSADVSAEFPPRRAELLEIMTNQGPVWLKSGQPVHLVLTTGRWACTGSNKKKAAVWASETFVPAVAEVVHRWSNTAKAEFPDSPCLSALAATYLPYSDEDLEILGLK